MNPLRRLVKTNAPSSVSACPVFPDTHGTREENHAHIRGTVLHRQMQAAHGKSFFLRACIINTSMNKFQAECIFHWQVFFFPHDTTPHTPQPLTSVSLYNIYTFLFSFFLLSYVCFSLTSNVRHLLSHLFFRLLCQISIFTFFT